MARTLPPGIFPFRKGFRAYVRVAGQLHSKIFAATATIREMRDWRDAKRVDHKRQALREKPSRGTFADDIARYLRIVAAMPTITYRTRDLIAWRDTLGDHVSRHALTPTMIREQLNQWRMDGPVLRVNPRTKVVRAVKKPLSASACNHRRTALLHLFTVLDGKDAPNPVRAVPAFVEPPPQPRARNLAELEAVIAKLRSAKSRARASVLLWTGIRGNSELGKMRPQHVNLEARVCHVPTGKGGRRMRLVPLNAKGVAAWKAFAAAKAWGTYDAAVLRKSLDRAARNRALATGVEHRPLRTYDLRHSVATAYLAAGADLADVQDLLGHSTPRMTRRYAPQQRAKLLAAADRLG